MAGNGISKVSPVERAYQEILDMRRRLDAVLAELAASIDKTPRRGRVQLIDPRTGEVFNGGNGKNKRKGGKSNGKRKSKNN